MKFAIIGAGLIGKKRAAALKSLGGHEIVAWADVNLEAAKKCADEFGGKAFSDYKQALAVSGIDAAIVATTHQVLAPITMEALERGLHVLVEKPAGIKSGEIDAVAKKAKEKKLVVKVGYNHRFHPAFMKARQLIKNGDIGKVYYVRASYGHGGRLGYDKEWRAKPEMSGGGELIDQGSHLIDLSRALLGYFSGVDARLMTYFWDMPVEDNAFLTLSTSRGQVAFLHASWTQWKNYFIFEIFGSKGQLRWEGLGRSYGVEKLTHYKMDTSMQPPKVEEFVFEGEDQSFVDETRNFIDSILGKAEADGSIEDALANMKVIEIAYAKGLPGGKFPAARMS